MEKKRIYYLDIAKGIGAVLMIIGHIAELSIPTREFVTSFHMPLFFVISGMIICATGEISRDMGSIRKRKFRSIMIPYFVFSVLSLLVEMLCTGLLKNGTWAVFKEHLFATICLAGASVFWFLPALFFGELIFIGIRKKTSAPVCGVVLAVLAVLAYIGLQGEYRLQGIFHETLWYSYAHLFINAVLRVFFTAAYVAVGYFSYQVMEKVSEKWGWNLLLGVVLMGITVFVSQLNGITDMNYMVYNNMLLYLVTSLSGSFGILFLSRTLGTWHKALPLKVCMYYGRNSLIVMMTHAPFYIMYIAARVTYAINNHIFPLGQILLCTVLVCGVLVIEVPVIEIINRYLPFLLGRFGTKKEAK